MSKSKKRQPAAAQRRTTRPTATTKAEADAIRSKECRRENLRREALRVGVVVLVLAVVTGVGYLVLKAMRSDVDAPAIGASEHELVLGSDDAPHDVIIYEDFLCPHCGDLERALSGRLAGLADEGTVRVSYRPFNLLGGWAEEAAAAFAVVLQNSEPEVALAFHDLLYANQPSAGSATPSRANLVALAIEAGADAAAVEAGILSGAGKEWVEGATDEADDAGVNQTPIVLLDGEVFEEDLAQDRRADALIDELG